MGIVKRSQRTRTERRPLGHLLERVTGALRGLWGAFVIIILNQKGGTAKTTSVLEFAKRLLRLGKTVLIIDMDAQANVTQQLGFVPGSDCDGVSIYEGLIEDRFTKWSPALMLDQVVSLKSFGAARIDLIPGDVLQDEALKILDSRMEGDNGVPMRLRETVKKLRPHYDYILIDNPPSHGGLVVDLALNAGDVLLIPVDGVDAASGSANVIDKANSQNEKRALRGQAPLQTLLYAPHVSCETKAPAFGDRGVKNKEWYPTLYDAFDLHFIHSVVKHSVGAQRGQLTQTAKRDYDLLFAEIMQAIHDPNIPILTDWMEAQGFTTDAFRARIQKLRDARRRKVDAKRVQFYDE